jgi:hypothetical protein
MKKIQNLGKRLTKNEQRRIFGGDEQVGDGSGGGSCPYTFDPGKTVSCPAGMTGAGCRNVGNGWEAYCYVDSSNICYAVGAATCS